MTALENGGGVARQAHEKSADEVVSLITDGMTVGIGGFINTGHPMSIIRVLIQSGVKDLTVVGAASAGLEVDMLVAAGIVRRVVAPYVGAEGIASVGPAFRFAAQRGEIEIFELDEAHYYAGLRAAAQGLPFNPWRAGLGTSLPDINPSLVRFLDPIGKEPLLAVPAIELDVCLLHAAHSDIYGNVRHRGTRYGDTALAAAAKSVAVSVEQVIPVEQTRANPLATSIDGADYVVRATYGAHPFAAEGFYRPDEEHLRGYVRAATDLVKTGSREALDAYLSRYVYGPKSHADYLDLVGFERVLALAEF